VTTPHQRRLRELEALRLIVADLDRFVATTTVGTVPREDVAAAFEQHTANLPEDSALLSQLGRLAVMIRQGPARTRVEGLRQISRRLRLKADEFAAVVEARDAQLRGKG
jgi:hypothetical protein